MDFSFIPSNRVICLDTASAPFPQYFQKGGKFNFWKKAGVPFIFVMYFCSFSLQPRHFGEKQCKEGWRRYRAGFRFLHITSFLQFVLDKLFQWVKVSPSLVFFFLSVHPVFDRWVAWHPIVLANFLSPITRTIYLKLKKKRGKLLTVEKVTSSENSSHPKKKMLNKNPSWFLGNKINNIEPRNPL